MKFRDNLLRLRAARNMTQEQLAMLLGVSRQAVSKWEAGQAYPEMAKLDRLCAVFNCTMDELVRGEAPVREDDAGLAVPDGAPSTDICGYDSHMRHRALLVSLGASVCAAGVAGFFGTGSIDLVPLGPDYLERLPGALASSMFSLLFLAAGLAGGGVLLARASAVHRAFMREHPYVADFYTSEQRERAQGRITASYAAAAAIIAMGIGLFMVQSGPLSHVTGGMASLLVSAAAALLVVVYSHLMARRMDVSAYNERAARACQGGCEAGDVLTPPSAQAAALSKVAYAEACRREDGRLKTGRRRIVATITAAALVLAAFTLPVFWFTAVQIVAWAAVLDVLACFLLPSMHA